MTPEAQKAIQEICARFPEWSQAQLASKVLVELRNFVTGQSQTMPTADYLRAQSGYPLERSSPANDPLAKMSRKLDELLDRFPNTPFLSEAPPEAIGKGGRYPPKRAGKA